MSSDASSRRLAVGCACGCAACAGVAVCKGIAAFAGCAACAGCAPGNGKLRLVRPARAWRIEASLAVTSAERPLAERFCHAHALRKTMPITSKAAPAAPDANPAARLKSHGRIPAWPGLSSGPGQRTPRGDRFGFRSRAGWRSPLRYGFLGGFGGRFHHCGRRFGRRFDRGLSGPARARGRGIARAIARAALAPTSTPVGAWSAHRILPRRREACGRCLQWP